MNQDNQEVLNTKLAHHYISQSVAPSVKYKDLVEALSDLTKPYVPDFGIHCATAGASN